MPGIGAICHTINPRLHPSQVVRAGEARNGVGGSDPSEVCNRKESLRLDYSCWESRLESEGAQSQMLSSAQTPLGQWKLFLVFFPWAGDSGLAIKISL